MKYYINKIVNTDIETATNKITAELQKEGFGIVTQFDVHKALKEKMDLDFRPYRILGACNPPFALKSINAEDKIGTFLPCNVMLQEENGKTEIAIINPVAMMQSVENEEMKAIANEIALKLNSALSKV
ncbi:MAG: hypothetical protein DRI94_10835 [Bacteroidetes bacterium]|nr:MAG: hypothetical protein DRI94_10835 [Bacteroidota bacterium]